MMNRATLTLKIRILENHWHPHMLDVFIYLKLTFSLKVLRFFDFWNIFDKESRETEECRKVTNERGFFDKMTWVSSLWLWSPKRDLFAPQRCAFQVLQKLSINNSPQPWKLAKMCKASRVKATACSGCHSCPKMAQDCPLCFSKGVFQQWSLLKDSLVSLSTRSFICPLCCGVHEGLDKFTLHLVSHEMEAKKNSNRNEDVPTISIKEGSAVDSLDELLADFSEFVKQEDKLTYDNQVKLRTKAPNPLRMSPKNKSPIGLPMSVISSTSNAHFPTIQTPLPLPQTFKPNQNLLMGHHHNDPNAIEKTIAQTATSSMMPNPPALTRSPQIQPQTAASSSKKSSSGDQPGSPPNQVQCSLCGWNFDNDEFLKVHTVLMHSKRNQAFLQRRLKRVVDEYKCRECDGTFAAYEDFVSHLKQVHNDHRFVCHICAKIFKLRGSLLVHLRVVHNPLGKPLTISFVIRL